MKIVQDTLTIKTQGMYHLVKFMSGRYGIHLKNNEDVLIRAVSLDTNDETRALNLFNDYIALSSYDFA